MMLGRISVVRMAGSMSEAIDEFTQNMAMHIGDLDDHIDQHSCDEARADFEEALQMATGVHSRPMIGWSARPCRLQSSTRCSRSRWWTSMWGE